MGKLTDLGRIIVFMFFFTFFIGFIHASTLMFMLAAFCLALLLISYALARWGAHAIECRREIPDLAIFSGDEYEITLILQETTTRWRWFDVFDQQVNLITNKTTHRRMSVMMEGGARHATFVYGVRQPVVVRNGLRLVELHDVMIFPQRGHYRIGPLKLISYDIFGIFSYQRMFQNAKEVLVYPKPIPIQIIPLQGVGSRQTAQIHEVQRVGASFDFYGIRPYVHGDDLRRVHWKSTAHTGALVVKEFEFHASGGAHIVLDLQRDIHFGQEQLSTIETSITLAASIANYIVGNSEHVGLLTTGAPLHSLPADSGSRQMQHIMETLALAEHNGKTPLAQILSHNIIPGAEHNNIIVISPTTDIDILAPLLSMKGRSTKILLILLDAYSFQQATLNNARSNMSRWAFATAPLRLSNHKGKLKNPLAADAHDRILHAAIAAGIDTLSFNADFPLHKSLQEICGRL